jgi:hypothetical protein
MNIIQDSNDEARQETPAQLPPPQPSSHGKLRQTSMHRKRRGEPQNESPQQQKPSFANSEVEEMEERGT